MEDEFAVVGPNIVVEFVPVGKGGETGAWEGAKRVDEEAIDA